jgi:hypothetical protein
MCKIQKAKCLSCVDVRTSMSPAKSPKSEFWEEQNHRLHRWQWPLSGVLSIMMVKSAQPGARPTPYTLSTIMSKVVVYAPAERADTFPLFLLFSYMYILVGFGRACAPLRCAHLSFLSSLPHKKGRCAPPRLRARTCLFWAHYHTKRGAARPPRLSQLRCFLFSPLSFPLGPNSGRQGCLSFSCAKLQTTVLSFAAP